jgi:hypothetical protein
MFSQSSPRPEASARLWLEAWNGCNREAIQSAFSTASLGLTSSQPTLQLSRYFELFGDGRRCLHGNRQAATTTAFD